MIGSSKSNDERNLFFFFDSSKEPCKGVTDYSTGDLHDLGKAHRRKRQNTLLRIQNQKQT